MQNKKEYLGSISLILGVLLASTGQCQTGVQGVYNGENVMNQVNVTDDIKEIVLTLDGVADIEFVATQDVFGVQDLKYSPSGTNPLHTETSGSRLQLIQSFPKTSWNQESIASYKLLIPRHRKLTITLGNATLSGDIQVSDLEIKAGNLTTRDLRISSDDTVKITGGLADLDMGIQRSKRVKLGLGLVRGKLKVPESAEMLNTSGN